MNNDTSMFMFLLLEFSDVQELQTLYFFLFLAFYLMTITGNLLIIITIALDHHLHTPMYFFLLMLALLDVGTISVIVPKAMAMILMNGRSISYSGCVAQVFLYTFFATSNLMLLTIMAHDRHVAICKPLLYGRIMHKEACLQMVATACLISFLCATLHTGGTFAMTFCSNIIHQFFCEIPRLITLSCSDIYLVEVGFLVLGSTVALGCFTFIVITYMQIFAAVLRIRSVHSQKKALSTCLPHLTVVSLLILTAVFAYVRPPTGTSSDLDITFAIIYAITPPLLNPFIYSLRNKEIKSALWKMLCLGISLSNHV
ncbi:olfactory receptor 14I1-like [Varanus komodoensis]|uniref:olfactory receptor 14I1-like n=1 Tax=Varanus komodoensis TaxID=61221 RepID=UPI001CF77BEF|nr:olfactory receptor 14I1-like [Varanus komodoensis]